MVVSGTSEKPVFCKEFGDVYISKVSGSVTVEYYAPYYELADPIFKETYYPDEDGEVIIHGLGDVALAYIGDRSAFLEYDFANAFQNKGGGYASINNYVTISGLVYDSSGEQKASFQQMFYYSNCRADRSQYEHKFYNRFYTRMIRLEQVISLAWESNGQKFVLGIAYREGDNSRFFRKEYPKQNAGYGSFVPFYFCAIALVDLLNRELDATLTSDDIIYVEAYLYDGDVMTDRIHFDIDRKYYPQIRHFVFFSCFGFPETLYLTGRDERSSELKASFGYVAGDYLKYHTDLTTSHTANTGYIDEAVRDSVEDMVRSDKVYLYERDKIGDLVTITGVEFSESKPRTEPLNLRLTYRVAAKCQRKLSRGLSTGNIFDETFDSTFD